MGWDDNGLPTERRVQNYYGVRCDPSLPVRPRLRAARASRGKQADPDLAGRNFVELCDRLVAEDEKAFEDAVAPPRPVGRLVADLHDDRRRGRGARRSARSCATSPAGEAYQAEAPTLWDVDFRTAVAQAELEDRELPGRLPPHRASTATDGDEPTSSSRPRGPSCSPRASRWSPIPTTSATSRCSAPTVAHAAVRRARCPCVAHPLADPEKGSGIAMICTFGDTTDVMWWRELQLPTRPIIGRDGRLLADAARRGIDADDGRGRLRASSRARP